MVKFTVEKGAASPFTALWAAEDGAGAGMELYTDAKGLLLLLLVAWRPRDMLVGLMSNVQNPGVLEFFVRNCSAQ